MKRRTLLEIISFLIVLLFIYAAINKLKDYEKFVIQIGQSPLLIGLGPYIAWLVLGFELIIPVMLASGRLRLIGFYAAFTLMVMFTAYIVAILNFSSHIPCSCGGVLEKLGWQEHLVFNIAFVILSFSGVYLETVQRKPT
ncbi:MAG TPA: MauE/DoxX family redox-associated membrane protein, partial [Ohtaekwangia sp.]|nr:MauE/DoxX family redox-associated membrane protein [Ohtaekwangia sp.]